MAIEPVPPLDDAPVPGPQRGDESTFDDRMDAKIRWDETSPAQFRAVGLNVKHNAEEAHSSATEAATHAASASNYADAAQDSAGESAISAANANQSATNAANAATAAANSSTSLTANSTTSFAVGNGTKAFTVPAGKQFPNSTVLSVTSAGNSALRMFGPVASYVGTTLTLTINKSQGTGTAADWVIAPAGADGATGGTAGGQLTDALDEKKGTSPASSATPDIWSAGGNYVSITQTAAITGFPNAPQPGARRTLFVVNGFLLESSANMEVRGGTYLALPKDELEVVADTVSEFYVTVKKFSGAATSSPVFRNMDVISQSGPWVAPYTGEYLLHLFAASGSGAAAAQSDAGVVTSIAAAASGASAGAHAIKTFYATAGDVFNLVFGSRGLGVVAGPVSSTGQAIPGISAGDTTFIGPGVSITCGGGKGGLATVSTTGTAIALGLAGGIATGGDINIQGGASGTATAILGTAAATGGGSVSYKGKVFSSGNANTTGAVAYSEAATGGAGIGGNSGSVSGFGYSLGGGYLGASSDVVSGSASIPGRGLVGFPVPATSPLIVGNAAPASPTETAVGGSGSGGYSTAGQSGDSALLGGTGANALSAPASGPTPSSGSASLGGGSGGVAACTNNSGSARATSGNGGYGFAIIQSR